MTAKVKMVRNEAGRMVPTMVNGKAQVPYRGVNGHRPEGVKQAPPIRSCADFPADGDKRVPTLEAALEKCGLKDGMTISSHHHLRDGDVVAVQALEAAARLGAKDLMWFPSASFPSQASVIDLMDRGVVHHIEGTAPMVPRPAGRWASPWPTPSTPTR
jgi:citrate lyase subunit alpha/citrate CoA-transferase